MFFVENLLKLIVIFILIAFLTVSFTVIILAVIISIGIIPESISREQRGLVILAISMFSMAILYKYWVYNYFISLVFKIKN